MLIELNQLLGEPYLSPSIQIAGVTHDSRTVKPGDIYIAVSGASHNGHSFVQQAMDMGAAAIIVDRMYASVLVEGRYPGWIVENTRAVMGFVADAVYGHPTRKLHLVGVTGTNGKTSTTHIIAHMAQSLFGSAGVIGTLGSASNGIFIPGQRTTPEAPELQRIFSQMYSHSVRAVAMEVASHALVQGRVNGCLFDAAVFTNLTQDHLDFHGDMESYFTAKQSLFTDKLPQSKPHGKQPFSVVNVGSEWGIRLHRMLEGSPVLTFANASKVDADLISENVRLHAAHSFFEIVHNGKRHQVFLPLGGAFQVENALAALSWYVGAGGSIDAGIELLRTCPQIPGRFEVVPGKQTFTVVVDYAHTPDGLENVLFTARGLCEHNLICVFGCGGDRDRTKRPQMGEIASKYCDSVIVTSDNPRSENPDSIIEEIVAGIPTSTEYRRLPDRRDAIAAAVTMAKSGDVIVIAGKGHETYQIIGDLTLPFDDRSVAAEELAKCV